MDDVKTKYIKILEWNKSNNYGGWVIFNLEINGYIDNEKRLKLVKIRDLSSYYKNYSMFPDPKNNNDVLYINLVYNILKKNNQL